MPTESTTFLKNPAAIRRAIIDLQKDGKKLDLAVAFIGAACWLLRILGNPPLLPIC